MDLNRSQREISRQLGLQPLFVHRDTCFPRHWNQPVPECARRGPAARREEASCEYSAHLGRSPPLPDLYTAVPATKLNVRTSEVKPRSCSRSDAIHFRCGTRRGGELVETCCTEHQHIRLPIRSVGLLIMRVECLSQRMNGQSVGFFLSSMRSPTLPP